uniref:Uncharacterized protein n=1 Tax=Panagrellus redivivus TaxID=6233 RepID=A0A7E4WBQ5_PANRE
MVLPRRREKRNHGGPRICWFPSHTNESAINAGGGRLLSYHGYAAIIFTLSWLAAMLSSVLAFQEVSQLVRSLLLSNDSRNAK